MNRNDIVFCLLGGAAVTLGVISCAPVGSPPEGGTNPPAASTEPVSQPPAAMPPGALQERLESAIGSVKRRTMLTTHGFWTVFHAILGLGPSVELKNPRTQAQVKALNYICEGGELPGLKFLEVKTKDGKKGLDVRIGPAFMGQGHQDQFLTEMAEWNLPRDLKFIVNANEYTMQDFLTYSLARARVNSNQELSWTLPVVVHHFGPDFAWTNDQGEALSVEKLVRYELDANVEGAACGGTHRLFGLNFALHLHLQKGGKPTGVWEEIQRKTEKYRDLARRYQNPDGSFSTDFFRGPGNSSEMSTRINTTGHILEWLAFALPDEELKAEWVQNAANALCLMILDIEGQPMEGGTLYHAVHGLLIYYARVHDANKLKENKPHVPLPPGWKVVD